MSSEMRNYINLFENFKLNERVTDVYKVDEDDEDSVEIIEGELEYKDEQILNYKVEYHEDFGYQVLEVTCSGIDDVEDFFDEDEYEEILELIYDDVKPKRNNSKEDEIDSFWVAIDTRNGAIIHKSKNYIDRKFVSEWYDIPSRYVEIKLKHTNL